MSWSDGGEKVTVKWNGAFRLSDDEKDIAWMEDGAHAHDRRRHPAGLAHRTARRQRPHRAHASRRTACAATTSRKAASFLAAAIDKLIRHSGVVREGARRASSSSAAAPTRCSRKSIGSATRATRIASTTPNWRARRSCRSRCSRRILQRVPTEMSSDYDKATLFTMIASSRPITDAHRVPDRPRGQDHLERLRSAPHADRDHGRRGRCRRTSPRRCSTPPRRSARTTIARRC